MKTPFLSSFCPSGFRSVVRFSPKNLVPEILNLLTLVVRNCTSGPGLFINPFVIPTLHNYGVSTGSHNSLKTIHTRLNSSSHHLFRFRFHIFPTKPNPAHRRHHLFTLLSSSSQPPPVLPPLRHGIVSGRSTPSMLGMHSSCSAASTRGGGGDAFTGSSRNRS